ncbi:MAG: bifunctional aspartate transaminase/aspartate 4-decarboxylase [Betaproteobacteria bacterium]|nr:bifunctional aspartate transaminase/aspartate 4-decarboxylase [Betaproteobacteria bacterium]
MDRDRERDYEKLSPFELKNKLIELATDRSERMMLNAARGNPNWIALEPRHAFLQLGLFALGESERTAPAPGFGAARLPAGLAPRFEEFARRHAGVGGVGLLNRCLAFAERRLCIGREDLLQELAGAVLGDHYPTPPRMLPLCERIMKAFLVQELLGTAEDDRFDLFAVEGASAGVAYLFDSLFEAGLLAKGDRIALGTPIFTPYLELPALNDYELVEVEIKQDEARGWHYPATELAKLLDPRIKAFLLVNPSNPTAVSLDRQTLDAMAAIVNESRRDLVVISDDVYATFSPDFVSLAAVIPRNTVLIYSCSKFWGATGWRLGVIALHQDNVLDERICALPAQSQEGFRKRYHSIAVDPCRLKFIDRLVADSRRIGFNHTAGLSTPQQAQMALFALQGLTDAARSFTHAARAIVRRRFETLYASAGVPLPADARCTFYYATIDIPDLARSRYGEAFAAWLRTSFEPIDFVVRLAEEKGIVLLDGGGFDAPQMSVRVSLANLSEESYVGIGRGISELLADYHAAWEKTRRSAK